MHSRIYQILEASKAAAAKRIQPCDFEYDHYLFRNGIADYVDNLPNEDYQGEHERFMLHLKLACGPYIETIQTPVGEDFVLLDGFREKYFEEKYKKFQNLLTDLTKKANLHDFAHGEFGGLVHELKNAMDDKFGSYVIASDWNENIDTLDHFMRYTAKAKVRYVVRNILDYHW